MLIDLGASADERFEFDLVPSEHLLEEFRGRDRQAELRLMLTKRNHVNVRAPVVRPFGETLDADTLARLDLPAERCDFVAVLTTVDCRPDPDCRFNWLRIQFLLGADLADDIARPVACRLYPERAEDVVKRVRSVELGADLSIHVVGPAAPGVNATRTTTTEVGEVNYRIMTFGLFSPEPTWHFARTVVAPEVIGDFFLALVVAVPSGVEAMATMSVAAEAQLKTVPFAVPLLTRRRGDGLDARSFALRTREA
jgi:hypothetical protein